MKLTESDFAANESRRLRRLADQLAATRLDARHIGSETHLDFRTVQRAMRGEPIKSDAQARLEYWLYNRILNG